MFKIEVECDKENNRFTVRCGERYEDELCCDEALGVLARLLINGQEGAGLRTAAEHAAWKKYLAKPIPEDQLLNI